VQNVAWAEGKFLVRDQPHSKLTTLSYLIKRDIFLGIFGHLQIC
jgi:hypothetical protein